MAWLDLQVLFVQLLPDRLKPFTLHEMTEALVDAYGDEIDYDKVYYSYNTMRKNQHLRDLVQPINAGEGGELLFLTEAAHRICRHVVKGRLPLKMRPATAKNQKSQPDSKRNLTATKTVHQKVRRRGHN